MPAKDIERAAHLYAKSSPAMISYGLGVTEQSQGVSGVRRLTNLAVLTGNLGKRGAGQNPLRGQNNVQGSSDMGALPTYLTMYRPMSDDATRRSSRSGGRSRSRRSAATRSRRCSTRAIKKTVKAMYVFGEDIAQTDPNVHHVEHAMKSLELLVVHDIFENLTAKFAHVMLPGSAFFEKDGTFTNAERRIQLMQHGRADPGRCEEGHRDPLRSLAEARLHRCRTRQPRM